MLTGGTVKTVFSHIAVSIHVLGLQSTTTLLAGGFLNNIGVLASVDHAWGFVTDF
jgi:hypothetical protein